MATSINDFAKASELLTVNIPILFFINTLYLLF